MIAAGHVNVHFLVILLLPAVVACVLLAVTWYSRVRRQRQSEAKRAARKASGAKPRSGSARSRGGANAKRRRR